MSDPRGMATLAIVFAMAKVLVRNGQLDPAELVEEVQAGAAGHREGGADEMADVLHALSEFLLRELDRPTFPESE